MDAGSLIAALVLIAFIGIVVYLKMARENAAFNRLYKPVGEELDMDDSFGQVIAFQGEQSFTTQRFELKAGEYKLHYWFPENILVKVELFNAHDGDHEVIALAKGEGAAAFTAEDGRYFCTIEPADDEAEWEIEISRLGLPSGYRP